MMTQKTPVLVTGASGFLGEHLCRRLVELDYDVAGTYWGHRIDLPGMRCIPVDLTDAALTERMLRDMKPEMIFHCAAVTSAGECEKNPEAARALNVDAVRRMVDISADAFSGSPFVFVSTDLVFDGSQAPYRPDAEPKPLSTYGSLKTEAEAIALDHPAGCVVRAALLAAPPASHRGGFLTWMVSTLLRGNRLELFEDEVRTPVDARDVAFALERLAQEKATGIFHPGGPERLDRMEMGREVCAELGLKAELLEPRRLHDVRHAAPRPRDVSLDSSLLWEHVRREPRTFRETLREIAAMI
jgi:dTDP-4-dehydrorhamnose reductase